MKITKKIFGISFVMLSLLCACKEANINEIEFLIGTWKIENKDHYEAWEKSGTDKLSGTAYKMNEGQKVILERLTIRVIENQVTYEATVLNQNDGRTVPFTLNRTDKNWISFENKDHDFPKKIMYQEISNDTLLVQALGDNDEGFSYKLFRQIE